MTITPVPGQDIAAAQTRAVHDFLLARGWTVEDFTDVDDDGYPDDPTPFWFYPASFAEHPTRWNEIDDLTPGFLGCSIGEEPFLHITSAGNRHGCGPDHAQQEHDLPVPEDSVELDLATLAHLLDALEPQARAHDPRALIECRLFGPCGTPNAGAGRWRSSGATGAST